MDQRLTQNIFHVSADVSLMVGNVTQFKNRTMTSVRMSVKKKQNIVHLKIIMPGVLKGLSQSFSK